MIAVISLSISVISLLASLLNYYNYWNLQKKYNDMVKIQTQAALGALETQIRTAINDAYDKVLSMGMKLAQAPDNEVFQNAYLAAEEIYLNAYEDACGKYNDGKIDRERFRLMYFTEIGNLVDREPYNKFYSGSQSKYDATLKVYNEWYHPERN
ncbi:MAG: hypothetical protein IJR85_07005 [Synergistaceae bacterium]|nr:hypothetical protein [Synergistaceae bacterium]